MARLDFLRFHRNRCVSIGSDGLHRTTFQPSSKYCLDFRFHLMTKLPVTQVDSTVLPVTFFDQTPSDSRFCPLESGREYWTCVFLLLLKLGFVTLDPPRDSDKLCILLQGFVWETYVSVMKIVHKIRSERF